MMAVIIKDGGCGGERGWLVTVRLSMTEGAGLFDGERGYVKQAEQ